MFSAGPAKLLAAITKSRDMSEFIMSKHMESYSSRGPVALAWQWALTGRGPITVMDWHKGPPTRQDIEWQIDCPDEWRGRAPWDEVRAARGVPVVANLRTRRRSSVRFASIELIAAAGGSVTVTISRRPRRRDVRQFSRLPS